MNKTIIYSKQDTESLIFKVRLLIPELSKHVHNTFFITALPNERSSWKNNTNFSSRCLHLKSVGIFSSALKTSAFFKSLNYRPPSKITRHVCWLSYTGYQSPYQVNSIIMCAFLTNRKVWNEVPLRDFKFMRTFPLVRAQVFCIQNWRYFKVYLELL